MKPYDYVKSVRIRSYSGPYFPVFELNTGQNNSKYGHFSRCAHASVDTTLRQV